MKKLSLLLVIVLISSIGFSQEKNIVEVAVGSPDHTTLVKAVTEADLVETLQSKGPFTVFAPVNEAFDALPDGVLNTLLQPEQKQMLQGVLTYHVIAGKLTANDVIAAVKKGDGKAQVKTVGGGTLTVMLDGGNVKIMDANGNVATVVAADLMASNGVIHVIDTVLIP